MFKTCVTALLAGAAVGVVYPKLAVAEEQTDFSIERFRWNTNSDGVLSVESPRPGNHQELTLGLWLGYANDPLVAYRPLVASREGADGRERVGALVENRVGGSLIGAIGLWRRIALGAEIPMIVNQTRGRNFAGATAPLNDLSKIGFGDIRIIPKIALLSGGTFELSFLPSFTLPTGGGKNYFGDSGLTFVPELAMAVHSNKLRVLANLGYRARKNTDTANLRIGDELGARLGFGYAIAEISGRPVDLGISLNAATNAYRLTDARFNQVPIETNLGLTVPISKVDVLVAGGIGNNGGYGTPDWRALIGIRYHDDGVTPTAAPVVRDADGDKIYDDKDRCVNEAEDFDSHDDADGCPDLDNDGDGIVDTSDKCPNEAEVINSVEDTDGCPDAAITDQDNDGITDSNDRCPQQAEDKDGFEDTDGCPDPDNDQDGVVDATDTCVDKAGPSDHRGCPDTDRDNDTVVDRLDNCPDEPGTVANQGCKVKQSISLTNQGIEIIDQVYFDTNRDTIQRRSFKLLSDVAEVMKSHPELSFEVQGHTDDRGDDAANQDLSSRRAQSVVTFLTNKGVTIKLKAIGYGEAQPIDTNGTAAGRAKNRRVVFKVVGSSTIQQNNSGPAGEIKDK